MSAPYAPTARQNGTTSTGASRPAWSGGRPAFNPAKDRTITRLACLKAAAEFAASRPDLKSADVLKVAAVWEKWVNRSG